MRARKDSREASHEPGEDFLWTPVKWTGLGFTHTEENPIHAGYVLADRGSGRGYDMHYGLEIGVVLSGRVRRHYRTLQTDLGAGQGWFCGMWERHGWEVLTPSCRHFVLVIRPKVLLQERFPEDPGLDLMAPFTVPPQERPQARGGKRSEILAVMERFKDSLRPDAPERSVFLELLALELLLMFSQDWNPRPSHTRTAAFQSHYASVNQAVQLALSSRRPLTTGEAAEACGLSERAFASAFRELMGISFAKFALRARLSGAATQLVETDDPEPKIATEWGFANAKHLQRSFKEHYAVSPLTYRQARLNSRMIRAR